MHMADKHDKYGNGVAFFWFVIVFLIIYLLLAFFKPEFVQRSDDCEKTGELDPALALLWALGLTFLFCFIVAVIYYAFYCY
jgi:competence protein ComGC